jgi:hypothetical protein
MLRRYTTRNGLRGVHQIYGSTGRPTILAFVEWNQLFKRLIDLYFLDKLIHKFYERTVELEKLRQNREIHKYEEEIAKVTTKSEKSW